MIFLFDYSMPGGDYIEELKKIGHEIQQLPEALLNKLSAPNPYPYKEIVTYCNEMPQKTLVTGLYKYYPLGSRHKMDQGTILLDGGLINPGDWPSLIDKAWQALQQVGPRGKTVFVDTDGLWIGGQRYQKQT